MASRTRRSGTFCLSRASVAANAARMAPLGSGTGGASAAARAAAAALLRRAATMTTTTMVISRRSTTAAITYTYVG